MDEVKSHAGRDQFIKMVLVSVTGFFLGKLVENSYDTIIEKHRNKSA